MCLHMTGRNTWFEGECLIDLESVLNPLYKKGRSDPFWKVESREKLMFGKAETERYARHILLKEIGGRGQQALSKARLALVGLGGLGAPAALYLTAAGIGGLGLFDDDHVALSNLQRQILYGTKDTGQPKVSCAARVLERLNHGVSLETHGVRLCSDNVHSLLKSYDLVLDGSDNFETRCLVNQACYDLEIPLISGAVGQWDGQLAVFEAGLTKHKPPGQGAPCYQCFMPKPPVQEIPCADAGIMGALPGIIGSFMALEAMKYITGAGQSLTGRLFLFEGLEPQTRIISLLADPACPVCGSSSSSKERKA